WDMSKLTRNNRGLVGKVARDLLEASARPSDVQGLYDFCKSQNWSGSFTPSALSSQWANYYALKHKSGTTADYIENEAGMIFHRYVPDPNRPPMFNYNRPLITITEEELATGPQTLEECKAEFERVLAELTNKMTLKDDEVDLDAIPEDEELRAILW
ncbi:MAG: hypothetical protein KJ043_22015, partial [Anaerolineae bacterium]|nr:hypothetical protein [Anaerolineae bacterium]